MSSRYAEGLRWIGSLCHAAANRLEQVSAERLPLEPHQEMLPPEEFVYHLRHHIQSRSHYY